jgi:hypothetical protein
MKRNSILRDDHGAVAVLVIVVMVAFLGILALVVDLGHLHTVQNELWNAADACALRGARAYVPDIVSNLSSVAPDPANAKSQASITIGANKSDNAALKDLPLTDIQVGIWNYETSNWVGGAPVWTWPPDASLWGHYIGPGVGVFTKRSDSYNSGPVGMTLAQIFGISTVPVGTKATAALSGIGGFYPGTPVLPFGAWRDDPTDPTKPNPALTPGQELLGVFRNDTSDTMGWTNLDPKNTNPSASEIKKIMNQGALYDCPFESTVGIQNGVASSAIKAMTAPNNRFGLTPTATNRNIYEPTGTNPDGVNYADVVYMLPIYYSESKDNKFNQSTVVGGIPVQIVRVTDSPENSIDVRIVSGPYVAPGYGGGAWYGILSTQPKLVK